MAKAECRIGLGDKVRDEVSGLEGIAVSVHVYLKGCTRVTVQPPVSEKEPGKLPDSITFDEAQLEILEASVVPCIEASEVRSPQGDRENVPSRTVPLR